MNFFLTSPTETKPQWQVVNPGESWSITESFMAPGLDAVTQVQKNHHRNRKREYVGVLAVIATLGSPAYANTTVANPSSTSTGSVVNNAYQMMTGPHPIYRMSQGIQCPGPTLPCRHLSRAANYDLPFESINQDACLFNGRCR